MKLAKQWTRRAQCAGTSLIEYGMLLALVSIVAMVVVKTSGSKAASTYDNIQSQMTAQGLDSVTPQSPGGASAATPTGSSGSSGSSNSGGQGREKQNHDNHRGQH
ncbi:MAG: hypothetical protein NT105_21240 [Verrucomicrobia bacterium]|nr:hypothetical protein [Verrucomicrobiota bacterium]